jgi:hypothetical protein
MGAEDTVAYGIVDQIVGTPISSLPSTNGTANGTAESK